MKKQQGFTLIELMIVVAIVAILAAIALPAYQDYIRKARVTEVIAAASSARTAISEYVANQNALPPADWTPGFTATQYVSALAWDGSTITATAQAIGSGVDGQTITLTPGTAELANGVVSTWTCEGSIPEQYRPGSCQGAATTTTTSGG